MSRGSIVLCFQTKLTKTFSMKSPRQFSLLKKKEVSGNNSSHYSLTWCFCFRNNICQWKMHLMSSSIAPLLFDFWSLVDKRASQSERVGWFFCARNWNPILEAKSYLFLSSIARLVPGILNAYQRKMMLGDLVRLTALLHVTRVSEKRLKL